MCDKLINVTPVLWGTDEKRQICQLLLR